MTRASSLTLDDFEYLQPYYNTSNYPYRKLLIPGQVCAEDIRKDLYYIFQNGLDEIY